MIEAVEALVAETGLGLLTGARQAKITEDEIKSARELGPYIGTQSKRAIARTIEHRAPKQLNYKRTLSRLAKLASHCSSAHDSTPRISWLRA